MISSTHNQVVVLLHGLAASRLMMFRLSNHLDQCGYATANWGYSSTRGSIEHHAEYVSEKLLELVSEQPHSVIHLVTHSMGGIVVRRALGLFHPPQVGRLVMLAPPNRGSHVARKLSRTLGRLCPALRELSDAPRSYVNQLGNPADIEFGIIAAAADRVVALSSTYLPNQSDHIVLPGHHGVLPWKTEAAEQVQRFLSTGAFDHSRVSQSHQPAIERSEQGSAEKMS